jgi:hypothetical protein
MRILAIILIGLSLCGCSSQKNFQEAERATDEFYMQYAKGNYGGIYDASDSAIKTNVSRDQMIGMLQKINRKLGACGAPERRGFRVNYDTKGTFVTLNYTRKCAKGQLNENFVWRMDGGQTILDGYHFNSPALATD